MIVHCMISVLFSVYKLAYFGIQLTNTISVFRLESSPIVTSFANFHRVQFKEIGDGLQYCLHMNKGAQETLWVQAELRSIQTYLRNLPALGVVY